MRVESGGHGVITDEELNREERADEFLLMGLRLAEGIDPRRYAALSGRPLDPHRIAMLREIGARFDRSEAPASGGETDLDLHLEGGHSHRRIFHAASGIVP